MCTLAEIFASVELEDTSDGILVLHGLLQANGATSPTLIAAIQKTITGIQDGSLPAETPPAPLSTTTE